MRAVVLACLGVVLVATLGGLGWQHLSPSQAPLGTNASAPSPDDGNASDVRQVDAGAPLTEEEKTNLDIELGYVHDEVLIALDDGANADDVNAALAAQDAVLTKDVSDQDLSAGFVKVELAGGASVDDSIRTLGLAGLTAQPNYLYQIMEGEDQQGAPVIDDTIESDAQGEEALATQASTVVNDSRAGEQWALDSTELYRAWDIEKAGLNDDGSARSDRVSVAIIDTGAVNHIDLNANVIATYNAKTGKTGIAEVKDDNSHGSHVAGITSAVTNNGQGVAGASYNAGLVVIKATNGGTGTDRDMFTSDTLANAYAWLFKASDADSTKTNAEYYNVRVVNMSVGGKHTSNNVGDDILTRKIRQAYTGIYADTPAAAANAPVHPSILTVAAAGNYEKSKVSVPYVGYPGDYSYCISVINLNKSYGYSPTNNVVERYKVNKDVTTGSNYNVDDTHIKNISAPGTNILSTMNGGGSYGSKTGTSMASPLVAGIASLMFSENPALSAEQVRTIIYATARDINADGWDRDTGYGEINAYNALQIASATLGADSAIEYKNREVVSIAYGDGTGWETYGSANQWEWSISDSSTIEMTVDADAGTISLLGIAPGSATLTGTFKDAEGNANTGIAISKTLTVNPLDISKASVSLEGDLSYTGSAITPTPTITINGTDLVEGVDYTVSYADNVQIGTATITITGIGNCAGSTKTESFEIGKASVAASALAPIDTVTYTGLAFEPTPSVTLAGFGTLVAGTDFTYEYVDNVNAGTAKVRIVGTGSFAGQTDWLEFTIAPADISTTTIAPIDAITYTSNAITPEPPITMGSMTLVKDQDYTLAYDRNVDASTEALVTVTGCGNYAGMTSVQFTILPRDISAATVTVSGGSFAFTGREIEPDVTATLAGLGDLAPDMYTLTYADNLNAGTARVTLDGTGNYAGTATGTFTITPISLADANVSTIPDQAWTGRPVEPVPTITAGDVVFEVGRDFVVTYENNIDTGTGKAFIQGTGNCTGVETRTFAIVLSITPDMIAPIPDQPYTGVAIEPGITVSSNGMTLIRNINYTVEFSDNVNVGTASVKITGIKGCAGEVTTTFEINPVSIAMAAYNIDRTYPYSGNGVTPTPPVSLYGFGELESGTDFTYEYRDNTNAGSAQMRIVGTGNFVGETEWRSFGITKRDLSGATVSIEAQSYTGKNLTPEPTVTIDGKTLVKGTDYKVNYFNNVNTGMATAVIEGLGNYRGHKDAQFEIRASIMPDMISATEQPTYTGSALTPDIVVRDAGKTLKEGTDYAIEGYSNNVNAGTATVTVSGMGMYTGKADGTFTIKPASLASASISVPSQNYAGSAVTPNPTVTLPAFGTLSKDDNYTLSYANNSQPGTATVTVTGTGNFTGVRRANFVILGPGSGGTQPDGQKGVLMQRLYNANSGEHFYTADEAERDSLVNAGWVYEGTGWSAPSSSGTPVYRLYNANAGDHHYTTDVIERASLLAAGWSDEGIGWYSDESQRVPLYRQYNPNAVSGSHNYTTSVNEREQLVDIGWHDEGISWYGL